MLELEQKLEKMKQESLPHDRKNIDQNTIECNVLQASNDELQNMWHEYKQKARDVYLSI